MTLYILKKEEQFLIAVLIFRVFWVYNITVVKIKMEVNYAETYSVGYRC